MTNKHKALFFDIDGTLYDSSIRGIRPSTINKLQELEQMGDYDLYIATGRSMVTFDDLLPHFKNFKGFVLSNGQYIIVDGKCIYNEGINSDDVNNFIEFCNNFNYSIAILTNNQLFINIYNERSYNNFSKYIKTTVTLLNNHRFTQSEIVNQIWLFTDNDEIDKISSMFPHLNIIKWGKYGADVVPKGASKGSGVKRIIEHLGYNINDTYAFGDADNDYEMLQVVGTGVCMNNGSLKAKSVAKYIADDIKEDGLAKAIDKLILNKKN